MTQTFHARLHGDRIEWIGVAPVRSVDDTPVEIEVRVSIKQVIPIRNDSKKVTGNGINTLPDFSQSKDPEKSRHVYEILTRLTALPNNSFPEDAVAWQREIRKDRPLPGREEDE